MKKLNVSVRTALAIMYPLFAMALLGSPIVLAIMVIDVAPSNERWMYVGASVTTLVAASVCSYIFGFDAAKKKFRGRAVGLEGLTWPGTILPQSASYFQFLGKQTLGSQSLGIFRKVRDPQTIVTGLSPEVQRGDLFCVLSPPRILPVDPGVYKVTYDQHYYIGVIPLPDLAKQRRENN